MTEQIIEHKKFTMGVAPYKLLGVWSVPSQAILEANPSAYNMAMANRPKACTCSCSHCGTGIIHHFIIADKTGAEFAIGSTCVDKLNDTRLTTRVKMAEKARLKAVRAAKKEEARIARNLAVEIVLDAEREVNGGLTNRELLKQDGDKMIEAFVLSVSEVFSPIGDIIAHDKSNFARSIYSDVEYNGVLPRGGAVPILVQMMTKPVGRSNSAAYKAQYPINEAIVADIFKKIETLTDAHRVALNAHYYP